MLEWREIEKIPAKLGCVIATLARKNAVPGRAFGVCLQAPHELGATGGSLETTRAIRGLPKASIWGHGGDALNSKFYFL